MKKKSHIEYLDTAMLPCYIGFTSSKEAFESEMSRLGVNTYAACYDPVKMAHATTTCVRHPKNGTTIIVSIGYVNGFSPDQIAGLMTHEATHCLDYVLDAMGEDDPGAEFKALTVQWLVQKFLLIYKDEWKKNKKPRH